MAAKGNMFINLAAIAQACGTTQEELMKKLNIVQGEGLGDDIDTLREELAKPDDGMDIYTFEVFCRVAGHFTEPISY